MKEPMNKNMYKTAIEMFIGVQLVEMVVDDAGIEFTTIAGEVGTMEPNYAGNWDICMDEELVYEVENVLEPLLAHTDDKNLLNLYKYSKEIDDELLKDKSKLFVDVVRGSIEKILIVGNLPLEGRAVIKNWEVIYKNRKKFLISLN